MKPFPFFASSGLCLWEKWNRQHCFDLEDRFPSLPPLQVKFLLNRVGACYRKHFKIVFIPLNMLVICTHFENVNKSSSLDLEPRTLRTTDKCVSSESLTVDFDRFIYDPTPSLTIQCCPMYHVSQITTRSSDTFMLRNAMWQHGRQAQWQLNNKV